MKITRWTYWSNQNFKTVDSMDKDQFDEATETVIQELKNKGYSFTGKYHQEGLYGCPVIDNTYLYNVSQRSWGNIMCKAYGISDRDGMGYTYWAWDAPKGALQHYPDGTMMMVR